MRHLELTRLLPIVLLLAVSVACSTASPRTADTLLRELVDRPPVLESAENQLIAECMRRAGMHYPFVPPRRDERAMIGLVRGAVPFSPADAQNHGYPDALINGDQDQGIGPVEAYAESLSADAKNTFYLQLVGDRGNDVRLRLPDEFEVATSSAGCQGSARQYLYGSVSNFLTVFYLPELAQRRAASADADPDVRNAYRSYSQCMTAGNFRIATPAGALALAKTYYPAGHRERAGTDEKTLAVTDAQCRIGVRLHERRAQAVDRIVRSWLTANEQAVRDAHAVLESAVVEAVRTAESGGDGRY